MTDTADIPFFEALRAAFRRSDEADECLGQAIDRALETESPAALKDKLLRQLHLHRATDLSAIWDALPVAPRGNRPN